MFPVVFQTRLFGLLSEPWQIHTYGLLIASGFLIAMFLISREAKRVGEDSDRVVDFGFYMLLAGLIGARVLFIVTRLPDYLHNPLRVLKFWQGGLVWYGGFIAAAVYAVYYCRRHRVSFFKYADIVVPYMALAHALGRLGCFSAGCCHGSPTTQPWGVVFPLASIVHQAQQSTGLVGFSDMPLPVHPTQLYEAAVELLLCGLLLVVRRRKRYDGQLLLLWVFLYAAARAVIEMFRGDYQRGVYMLSTSQYVALLASVVGLVVYTVLRHKRMSATVAASESATNDAAE